jgi:hypothetical protein
LRGALLETSVPAGFARLGLVGLRLALLEWLRFARLEWFLFTTLRPEGGALIGLRAGIFVVSAVAPAYRWTLRLGGRQDFDFCLSGWRFRKRLRRTRFWFIAGHGRKREHL